MEVVGEDHKVSRACDLKMRLVRWAVTYESLGKMRSWEYGAPLLEVVVAASC